MRTKSNIFLIFVSFFLAILFSCSEREAYSRFYHIKSGKWSRDSVLVFTIDSLASSLNIEYDVTVELTTNRSYPYRDLSLLIDHTLTDSLIRTDTLRFFLADEYGKWLGAGTGGLNQLSLPYCTFIPRDSVSSYQLAIRHGMERERLSGIEKVGIKMLKVNKNNR